MRCWDKRLIPLLPDDQLAGQWRECCEIASNLATLGTPNHLLVNRILEYPIDHFYTYTSMLVIPEMKRRGYMIHEETWSKFIENLTEFCGHSTFSLIDFDQLFQGWMSTRYLHQCIDNLEELYDCGGIELKDWFKIVNGVRSLDAFCQETFDALFI